MCHGQKSRFVGDGHPTFNRNPFNEYINPYYWVHDHPLLPRGPAEAVAFFVRQSGPLSRTADMPESSAGNTDRQELMSLRRPPGWISV